MNTSLSVMAIIFAVASIVANVIVFTHTNNDDVKADGKSLPSKTGPAITIPPPPKTNDKRIVRKSDGKYYIQYYWDVPGWLDMQYTYETPKEAVRMLEAISKKSVSPVVVEVVELKP